LLIGQLMHSKQEGRRSHHFTLDDIKERRANEIVVWNLESLQLITIVRNVIKWLGFALTDFSWGGLELDVFHFPEVSPEV